MITMRWIFLCFFIPVLAFSQDAGLLEPLQVIDTPTAGTLMRGSFRTGIDVYPDGGILAAIGAGITERFMFGISYGGTNIIGTGKINWNKQVGAMVRYRLFEEDYYLPAILIGFDSQGHGAYLDSTKRYINKSHGLFAVASKSFILLGTLSVHGGINYSFENEDGDKDPNLFFAVQKSLNPELFLAAEYDLAINDGGSHAIGTGHGYLNAALKWQFSGKLELSFVLKDILKNNKYADGMTREIRIAYSEIF
jgi:hypothetical protein